MQRRLVLGAIMAAARGFPVYGDELGTFRPCLAHPGGEGRREQRRIDAVHEQSEPASARNAVLVGQIAAQEADVRVAPGGDGVEMIAIGHGGADDEQQHLAQRMRDAPGLARVVDDREMVEKRLQTRLLFEHGEGEAHDGGSRITPPIGNHLFSNPLTAVNPNSEPCSWRAIN